MILKPKIILYGAFDRYNYGDNLMPILLENYFLNYNPNIMKNYDLVFSSVLKSDLSHYLCKPTTPICELLDSPDESVLIVVGGETMGATIQGLYLHTFTNNLQHKIASLLSRFFKPLFIPLAFLKYPSPWYYPYIPNKESFKHKIKIVLNTVGGGASKKADRNLKKLDYISVRDYRSYEIMSKTYNVKLIPDSVLLISRMYSVNSLKKMVREKVLKEFDFSKKYIIIQMCPYKSSCDPKFFSKILLDIKAAGVEPILLPIGYASGHDDVDYLREVQYFSGNKLSLFYELTVWEIAYFIAMSKGFYGTSLHGVITAMAYRIPHFCINGKLEKLTSFMETWSISPFSKPINPVDIVDVLNVDYDVYNLDKKVNAAQDLIEQHYEFIVKSYLKGNIS